MSRSSNSKKEVPIFLTKIYEIVDKGSGGLVQWADNGGSFIIQDAKRFAKEVLPHYFKTANFNSFVRQLNFYGFRKINFEDSSKNKAKLAGHSSFGNGGTKAAKHWEFHHMHFLRGRTDLLIHIKRKTYADSSMASKEELESLREEVQQRTAIMTSNTFRMKKLEEMCTTLQSELVSMKSVYKSQMENFDMYRSGSTRNPFANESEDTNSLNGLMFDDVGGEGNTPSESANFGDLTWKFEDTTAPVTDTVDGTLDATLMLDFEDSCMEDVNVDLKPPSMNMLASVTSLDLGLDFSERETSEIQDETKTTGRPASLSLPDLTSLGISSPAGGDSVEVESPSESQKTLNEALAKLPKGMSKEQFLSMLITTISAMFPQAKEAYEKHASSPSPVAAVASNQSMQEFTATMMMACLLPHIQMALLTTVAASAAPSSAFASLSGKV